MVRSSRACGLLAATMLSVAPAGWAQTPPPPAGEPAANGAPPPARVGRLSSLQGTVSFHAAGSDGWVAAVQNYPVTGGDAVFAQSGGHAEMDAGNDLVELDGGSELDVATLDHQQFVASEPQGRMFLALGPQPSGAVNSIATPRGTVQIAGQGEFEIIAGDSSTPTVVTVVQGSAAVTANGLSLQVPAGQTATIEGTDQLDGHVTPSGAPDPFLSAMLAAVARTQGGGLPPAVANMTGCQALAHVGSWHPSPQYGQVWYPPVQAGWTPYREGHWAYVSPWGWTWVDNESWGFAPFHYGRWVQDGGQWGWVPADEGAPADEYAEPVYAPALVSWTDVGAAALAGAAVGALAAGAIGWIPLGPNEPYYPPYHYDRGYFERVNRVDVRNIRNVSFTNVHQNFNTFVNRGGATLAPASALRGGEPIGRVARPFTPAAFAAARPVPAGHHPLGAPPMTRGEPGRGPALNPALLHPGALPGGRVPFRGGAAEARPGIAPAAARAGLPGLRPHDQVVTGRPGAEPGAVPGVAGRAPGEAGHPGLAGAAVGAAAGGAVGAGLAAHALHAGAGGPAEQRPQVARPGEPGRPQVVEPHAPAVTRPGEVPGGARAGEARGAQAHFAPHVQAGAPRGMARPEAPHVAARPVEGPRPVARPEAPRPVARPAEAPRPQARPVEQPRPAARPAEAPHFAPRPAPAPRAEPRPAPAARPAPAPRPQGREGEKPRR